MKKRIYFMGLLLVFAFIATMSGCVQEKKYDSQIDTTQTSFDIMSGAKWEEKTYADGSGLVYLTTDHFVLKMPLFSDGKAHWNWRESDDKLSCIIYCTDCDAACSGTGKLVTIKAYDLNDNSYSQIPKYCVIGDSASKRYIAIYPTDMQYNDQDANQTRYYTNLQKAVVELDPNRDHQWEISYPMMEITD